jgi:hypothetical protein
MARSTQQQLDDCDAAIEQIETGAQAYTIRSRSAQKALYEKLCAERARLEEKLADESNGGSMATLAQPGRVT